MSPVQALRAHGIGAQGGRVIAALVALLVAEHVAPPVAQARVAAVVEACEAATADATMRALCAYNAFRESRMDPNAEGDCTRTEATNAQGIEDTEASHLERQRERAEPWTTSAPVVAQAARHRRARRHPPMDRQRPASAASRGTCLAQGAWQLHAAVVSRFGAACGRDRHDVRVGACLFVASMRYWRARTPTLEAAMSSHMIGRLHAGGPQGRARVAWARRWAL